MIMKKEEKVLETAFAFGRRYRFGVLHSFHRNVMAKEISMQ